MKDPFRCNDKKLSVFCDQRYSSVSQLKTKREVNTCRDLLPNFNELKD